eukprot:11097247-Ditylum_brightwellii.AAC.1
MHYAPRTHKLSLLKQQSINSPDEEGGDSPSPHHLPMFVTERIGSNETNIYMGTYDKEMEMDKEEEDKEEDDKEEAEEEEFKLGGEKEI